MNGLAGGIRTGPRDDRYSTAGDGDYAFDDLDVLGMRCMVRADLRTPMLTSVEVPDGVDDAALRRIDLAAGMPRLEAWAQGYTP